MASFARCASRFSVHVGRAVGGRTTAPMMTLARMPAAAAAGGSGTGARRAYFGICMPQTGFRRGVSGRSLLMPVNAVAVGDKLPEVKFNYFDSEGNMQEITSGELFKGKKVIIFAVPGAFTPTCSLKHLPSFIEKADELKAKGVDTIACVAVNDAFVMDAWGKSVGAGGKVLMLADGSATFAKEIGVELDLTDKGLGVRSRRYAMLVDDQVVKLLNLEEGGAFTVSSADDILASL